MAHFSNSKSWRLKTIFSHASHHKLTIKNHIQDTVFPQNPFKKQQNAHPAPQQKKSSQTPSSAASKTSLRTPIGDTLEVELYPWRLS
jgi:hypothetical protein